MHSKRSLYSCNGSLSVLINSCLLSSPLMSVNVRTRNEFRERGQGIKLGMGEKGVFVWWSAVLSLSKQLRLLLLHERRGPSAADHSACGMKWACLHNPHQFPLPPSHWSPSLSLSSWSTALTAVWIDCCCHQPIRVVLFCRGRYWDDVCIMTTQWC